MVPSGGGVPQPAFSVRDRALVLVFLNFSFSLSWVEAYRSILSCFSKFVSLSLFWMEAHVNVFCLFSFFSITILQKHCRPQRDSNSDHQSRRRARWPLDHHHGPTHVKVIKLFWRKSRFPKNWKKFPFVSKPAQKCKNNIAFNQNKF